MSELRCGVAGLNRGRHFVELFEGHPQCRVVAVCDTDAARLDGFPAAAAHTDYDAFLGEGLDVVAVITPGPAHADQSVRAMGAGAHVLCETPNVYSVAEARDVMAAAQCTGRSYMLAEDYVWRGWVEALRARAADGAFGRIVYADGDYTHDCRGIMLADAVRTWRADMPPIIYCSHTLGPLLAIMDDRVVSAVGMSTGARTAPDLGTIGMETALMETAGGAVIHLTNGFTVACPITLNHCLVGTAGSARVTNDVRLSARWYTEAGGAEMGGWEDMPEDMLVRPDGRDQVAAMVDDFVESVLEDRPPPIDAHRSMDFVLPGIIAHESAQQGGVKLPVPDSRSW